MCVLDELVYSCVVDGSVGLNWHSIAHIDKTTTNSYPISPEEDVNKLSHLVELPRL